ncbi:MAG: GIY-YIG nuclease family protein [Candidatus Marinimicrobia bacterium]|nr:GIY-YIG nuclease family protein [Candidatus Neomarinimicrobiota bacterium]
MYFLYILYSEKLDKYYIGSTSDIVKRIERHNEGWGRFTKGGIPWELIYTEEYSNKSEALKRERYIKKKKSRDFIENLIDNEEH